MKIKELFFSSHGIRATFPATTLLLTGPLFRHPTFPTTGLLPRTFSSRPSPVALLPRTFSRRPSPVDLIRWTFFDGPSPTDLLRQTFSDGPSPLDLFPINFFGSLLSPAVYLQAHFQSHQLVMQSISTSHLIVMSHSSHINSPCGQFRRLFQRPQIYPSN